MIFDGVKKLIKPEGKLYKPVYGCPICMVPWWGTLIFIIFMGGTFTTWILTIGLAAGFAVLCVVGLAVREAAIEISNKLEKENK